jgi:uridine phosphorylase
MYPLLEFDPNPNAIINPIAVKLSEPCPERAVACFFLDVLQPMAQAGQLVEIGQTGSEAGINPLYRLTLDGQSILVFHPGVGAPLAAAFMDEVIVLGVKCMTACGGCGVLRPEIAAGHPVILTSAVRDEGTSFHYAAPSREIQADPAGVACLEAACQAVGIEYRLGKSWTTDGFYRETAARREARLREGCDVVEMEASAFFAVAQLRQVRFGQIVYGGDLVVPEGWDSRGWHKRSDDRRLLFDLAVKAVLGM